MGVSEILAQIDKEIAQLQQARALLNGVPATKAAKSVLTRKSIGIRKRRLSPEGRKRIAEAAKRRWAEQRKAAASK